MSGETSGPHDKLEGKQQEAHDEVSVQDSNLGHVAHARENSHDPETPSRSPQPPTHEERSFVKGPPVTKRKAHTRVRASRRSDEEWERVRLLRQEREQVKQEREQAKLEREQAKLEKRRLENERRLEGQRLEFERKREALARRKAQEVEAATASARPQSEREEPSTNGGEFPSQRHSGSEVEEAPRVQQRKPAMAFKLDGDQKVDYDEDAKTICAQVLEHDTGVTCLAITEEEHSESHLIKMAHPTSAVFFAPPSPPITPRYPSPRSGFGYSYYGNDDATHQCECWYQGGLVREDSQTSMESNYLFDPPLLRWPSPEPVETAETRQDATDVLFQPSIVRSGDTAGTPVVTINVIIPKSKTENYVLNDGVSTGDTTPEFQRDRHATGRGGYSGFRSRGRGRRGPRFDMS